MKKTPFYMRVYKELKDNQLNGGGFISYVEIARRILGSDYALEMYGVSTIERIRNHIYHVIDYAAKGGEVIVRKRRPVQNDSQRGFIIDGFKIHDSPHDDRFFFDDYDFKVWRVNAAKNGKDRYLELGRERGIISTSKYKELLEQ